MDHHAAQASPRRLKRMRSDVPLKSSFGVGGIDDHDNQERTITPDPNDLDLDLDLQNSIRAQQDSASKRARTFFSVDVSGSPIAGSGRASRFVEGLTLDAAGAGSAPSSGFSAAFRNALTPMWSGMSGMFARRGAREASISTASTNTPSADGSAFRPSSRNRFDFHDEQRTHSRQSNDSTAKDSGIYFFGGRTSAEPKHLLAMNEAPATTLRAALNHSPIMPTIVRDHGQSDVSPLKRLLHKASVSSLKKVRSHFAPSSLRRTVPQQAEDNSADAIPEVPAIPEQFLKPEKSRGDLKKQQKLKKKMGNLQAQLDQTKQEYNQLFGESHALPGPALSASRVETNPRNPWATTISDTRRPLPPTPQSGFFQAPQISEAMCATIEWANDLSPNKDHDRFTALPQLPGSPVKKITFEAMDDTPRPAAKDSSPPPVESPIECSRPLPVISPGKNFANDDPVYTESAITAMDWKQEWKRRSLSTIMSSRANSPESEKLPLAEIKPTETRRSSVSGKNTLMSLRPNPNLAEAAGTKQENVPMNISEKPSRFPKSPQKSPQKRKARGQSRETDELPTINAIRSPPRNKAGSPRKRSETDGVHKKRKSRKKSVGAGMEGLGYYNEDGDWVWGEETF